MKTLFEIGDELRALYELLDESGGEIATPEEEAVIVAWFRDLERDEDRKITNYYGLVRQLETESAAAKEESERFAKKAKARENASKRLKELLKVHMEMTGRKRIETTSGRVVAIQNNGGLAPLILADNLDASTLPAEFLRVRIDPDADAIRQALEQGQALEFAALGKLGTHIRFR